MGYSKKGYSKKKDTQIEEAIKAMPPLDIEAARKAMESGADGVALGFPPNYQWIVAMHDAYAELQKVKTRKLRLECAFFSFKTFFERGQEFPGSKRKTA